MVTITINERTKVGRTLVDLAQLLAANNKSITVSLGLNKTAKIDAKLTTKQRALINRLKKVKQKADAGLYETQTLKSFLNDL